MELILTSFGLSHLTHDQPRSGDDPDSHADAHYFRSRAHQFDLPSHQNLFARMPPVVMPRISEQFSPDYAVLLLCDRVILDVKTYELLQRAPWAYAEIAETLTLLHKEGFVRLEDFEATINRKRGLLEEMLERDLKELNQWAPILTESIEAWREFTQSSRDALSAKYGVDDPLSGYRGSVLEEALQSSRKRRLSKYRQVLRRTLAGYLSCVNANLLLSEAFQSGFHDWCDFTPFYRDKFRRVAREIPGDNEMENVRRLFDLSFPELRLRRPKDLLRALKDRRITDLRDLVGCAARGEVTFDREFAVRTLHEVLGVERGVGRWRTIVSYGTTPLGLIPWVGTPLQKGVEETAVKLVEKKQRRPFRWFYLISEIARSG